MNSEKWRRIVNNTLSTWEWGVGKRTTPNNLCRISPSARLIPFLGNPGHIICKQRTQHVYLLNLSIRLILFAYEIVDVHTLPWYTLLKRGARNSVFETSTLNGSIIGKKESSWNVLPADMLILLPSLLILLKNHYPCLIHQWPTTKPSPPLTFLLLRWSTWHSTQQAWYSLMADGISWYEPGRNAITFLKRIGVCAI